MLSWGSKEAYGALSQLLMKDEHEARAAIARALARAPMPEGLNALERYLADPKKRGHEQVLDALLREAGARALGPLLGLARRPERATRAAKYLVRFVKGYAKDLATHELETLAQLELTRPITRTVEIACRVVVQNTNRSERWAPTQVRQLAAQELSRRAQA